jgi:DNA-binding GntR family transcriptional regulator
MLKRKDSPRRSGRKGTGLLHAYGQLREKILHLELPPGASLDEVVFAKMLGVSRTPVRQAFIQLGADGLVDLLPNRSARVTPVDLPRVREFFEAFDLIQRAATHWAAVRRTDKALKSIDEQRLAFEAAAKRFDTRAMMDTNLRFHVAIGEACGNSLFAEHYSRLLTLALRLSGIALAYEGKDDRTRAAHLATIVREHRRMTDLLREKDALGVEQLAHQHTELFRGRVMEYLGESLASAISVSRASSSISIRSSR